MTTCRPASNRAWLWTGPQILLAQRVRPGPCGDFSDLVPFVASAHTALPFDQLLADAGYDSEANHRFCRERLGVDSLIPAKNVGGRQRVPLRQGGSRRMTRQGR